MQASGFSEHTAGFKHFGVGVFSVCYRNAGSVYSAGLCLYYNKHRISMCLQAACYVEQHCLLLEI